MAHIVGCKEAHELTTCRQGANQHANIILRKSLKTPASPLSDSETTEMLDQAAVTKAATVIALKMFAMSDVTKAHFLALDEAGQTTFLEKSIDDQAKEAEAAKAETDRKALEAEAAKSGKTVADLETAKTIAGLREEIDTLKADKADNEFVKQASHSDFVGYPGGTDALVPLLKDYAGLSEATRTKSIDLLKSVAATARKSMEALGGMSEADIAKATTALGRLEKAAKEVATAKSIPYEQAFEQVTASREHAEDVALVNGA